MNIAPPTETEIDTAVENGLTEFWKAIAKAFPNVTTGDADPESIMRFTIYAHKFVNQWLEDNHHALKEQKA